MPISPWYVGQTGESFTIYCRDDSNLPLPMAGVTASQLTLLIKPPVGAEFAGGGLFAITDSDNSIVTYQPAASDVHTAGTFQIAVEIMTTNGPIYSDRTTWTIQAR